MFIRTKKIGKKVAYRQLVKLVRTGVAVYMLVYVYKHILLFLLDGGFAVLIC